VKQNNNKSEGVDGSEQCSSNVREELNAKRTKCNSIAKYKNGWHIFDIRVHFAA